MSAAGAVAEPSQDDALPLSPWWVRGFVLVFVLGMAVLGYQHGRSIPQAVVSEDGTTLFTRADVENGQGVFLRYGLMDNGSIWGHGGYLGIDYSAEALHQMSLKTADALAQAQYHQPMAALDETRHARSMAFIHATPALVIERLRLPGDLVFIIFGSIPLTIATVKAWLGVRQQAGAA